MDLMAGRRVQVAGLVSLFLLLAGCSGHHGRSGSSGHRSDFVVTNAKVPAPCKTIDGALVNELIGIDHGVVDKKIDLTQAISTAHCSWDNGGFGDKTRKQGNIDADITVELKQVKGAPPYSMSKFTYNNFVANKRCKPIPVEGSEACWYPGPPWDFSVVVRRNYVTVWVASSLTSSPAASKKYVAAMAKRIAENVVKNIA